MQGGIAYPVEADEIIVSAFAAHGDAVRRGLARHVHDPAAAEDLAQEAFIRLVIEVRAGRTPNHIGSWLHRGVPNGGDRAVDRSF